MQQQRPLAVTVDDQAIANLVKFCHQQGHTYLFMVADPNTDAALGAAAAAALRGEGFDLKQVVLTSEEVRQLMVHQGIIPADWTEAEEQAQTESTGEQRSWLNTEAVWRSALMAPREPIVRYTFPKNRMEYLAPSGYELIKQYRSHPVARAIYDEMPVAEFRDAFSPRVYPVLTMRADADVLFDKDDVTITTDDVQRAIDNGRKRVGKRFAKMLLAEPE